MTIFAIVEPRLRCIRTGDFADHYAACIDAGLNLGELDFGTLATWPDGRSLSIIVYEYGLIKSDPEAYFGCEGHLYNGNAVIFQSDQEGNTVNISPNLADHFENACTHFLWFKDPFEVEAAITAGKIARPQSSINGETFWKWGDLS
jgi:hypothetical protein